MRINETQYPGQQSEPLGWFGNPINNWGRTYFHITNYKVVGYMDGQLWLKSKTGDASDSITINWSSDVNTVEAHMVGKEWNFDGQLVWDNRTSNWHIHWSNARIAH